MIAVATSERRAWIGGGIERRPRCWLHCWRRASPPSVLLLLRFVTFASYSAFTFACFALAPAEPPSLESAALMVESRAPVNGQARAAAAPLLAGALLVLLYCPTSLLDCC